jgi:hypothetical protein
MQTLVVRIPETLAADIEAEAGRRRVPKSKIVRERLSATAAPQAGHPMADIFAEIDRNPIASRPRKAAHDKKQLPEIIRAHYRAAKRHFR